MSKHGRVLVAMSGGIDSSVTAVMLHEQGYEVVGLTMKTWDYANAGGQKKETGCCSLDSINDARIIAVELGFPHFIIDIRDEFGGYVIDNFVEEYLAGRTPNPCVLCNTHIKWDALLRRADAMDCEFIATGHYASVREEAGRRVISKGKDAHKDQSYVLWGLKQSALARTIFPMGGYHKAEIREMALEMGFDHLVKKPESYEICFIPDNDYHGFLNRNVDGLVERVADGEFVLADGTVVGQHKGYPYYTIGQRKGLVAMGEPYYVTHIDPVANRVTIGKEAELLDRKMRVRGLNLVKYPELPEEMEALTKIRYKDRGAQSLLHPVDGQHVDVIFQTPVKAITPGQSAVFYQGDDVLGGGWIKTVG
ncbi:MAG: tRNA 2-thiouridine(34) synthase MnmA [Bacteroidota bacterium]